MKLIYANYICLLFGICLLIISDILQIDGFAGFSLVMLSVIFMMLGFMIGNNPWRVMVEFFKNLMS
ncbi:hypothetical protein ACS127_09595 [Amphibacillus sp. Q70]|uniref:hypothetical protein n=1 Tax=Amphibacillus sp. Q70 TaxID=3453416 RepID=UPI003F834DF8